MTVSDNDPPVFIDDETRGIAGTGRLRIECASGSGSKHHHCWNKQSVLQLGF